MKIKLKRYRNGDNEGQTHNSEEIFVALPNGNLFEINLDANGGLLITKTSDGQSTNAMSIDINSSRSIILS